MIQSFVCAIREEKKTKILAEYQQSIQCTLYTLHTFTYICYEIEVHYVSILFFYTLLWVYNVHWRTQSQQIQSVQHSVCMKSDIYTITNLFDDFISLFISYFCFCDFLLILLGFTLFSVIEISVYVHFSDWFQLFLFLSCLWILSRFRFAQVKLWNKTF